MKPTPILTLIFTAAASAAAAQGASHHYTLFEGANISVDVGNTLMPVRDIDGASWVVEDNGKERTISGNGMPLNLKIAPMLKMTEQSAEVSDFKKAPSYTFANDPSVRLTRGLTEAADVSASYQTAANQAAAEAANPTMVQSASASGTSSSGGNGILGGSATAAQGSYAASSANESMLLSSKQDSNGGYDAMTVEFGLSSHSKLNDPYLVTTARFHPPGTEAGTEQSLIYAKALPPIGPSPIHVKYVVEGFPVNYQLLQYQIHLYNHGVEVATNVSVKREEMTPEQAFEYVRKTYIAAHRADTLPASAVMGELPKDLHEHLEGGKYNETLYVKVTKDGTPDAAFRDEACTQRVEDPYLESVIRTIRFKPALAKGEPVEGVATVNLARLGV